MSSGRWVWINFPITTSRAPVAISGRFSGMPVGAPMVGRACTRSRAKRANRSHDSGIAAQRSQRRYVRGGTPSAPPARAMGNHEGVLRSATDHQFFIFTDIVRYILLVLMPRSTSSSYVWRRGEASLWDTHELCQDRGGPLPHLSVWCLCGFQREERLHGPVQNLRHRCFSKLVT